MSMSVCALYSLLNDKIFNLQVLTNTIQKDTATTLSDVFYAVRGLTTLSQKIPAARIDKLVKHMQAVLRTDDSLWK